MFSHHDKVVVRVKVKFQRLFDRRQSQKIEVNMSVLTDWTPQPD